jgi:hypothetical protein
MMSTFIYFLIGIAVHYAMLWILCALFGLPIQEGLPWYVFGMAAMTDARRYELKQQVKNIFNPLRTR